MNVRVPNTTSGKKRKINNASKAAKRLGLNQASTGWERDSDGKRERLEGRMRSQVSRAEHGRLVCRAFHAPGVPLPAITTVDSPLVGSMQSSARNSGVSKLYSLSCHAVMARWRNRVLPIHHATTPTLDRKSVV